MAVGGPSWPNLQCLVRRKPATAGWAEDADRGGVQRLAKTLSIPHLVAIGTFFCGMQSLELERGFVLSLNLHLLLLCQI